MDYIENAEMEMMNAIESLEQRLITVRAGRANASMLNGIMVEYYGAASPINALANITVPEARQLFIKPFDRSAIKDIERAINEANIGITPTNNGEMIILTVPQLTEETRRTYVKQVHEMGEQAKVALRNARANANNKIKKDESFTEDVSTSMQEDVQELINKYNKIVDEKIKEKENELMSI
jgi:ribosome recycling factor